MSSDKGKPNGLLDRVKADNLRPKRRWPKVLLALLVLVVLAGGAGFVFLKGSGLGKQLGLTQEDQREKMRRLYEEGMNAYKAEDWREADILFRQSAEVLGTWSDPVRMRAACLLEPKNPEYNLARGVELLRQATKINPNDDQSRLVLARVYLETGSFSESLKVAKASLDSMRRSSRDFPADLYFVAAQAAARLGELDEAIIQARSFLEHAAASSSGAPQTCVLLAQYLIRRAQASDPFSVQDIRTADRYLDQAEELARGHVQAASTDTRARLILAQILFEKGRFAEGYGDLEEGERRREARRHFLRGLEEIDSALYADQVLGAHPEIQVLLKVSILDRLERKDEADQLLEAEYEAEPRWILMAERITRRMRETDEAVLEEAAKLAQDAKSKHPKRPEFSMMAVEIAGLRKQYDEAARLSAEAEQNASETGGDASVYALILARQSIRRGEVEQAETDFLRALESNPRNLSARIGLLSLRGGLLLQGVQSEQGTELKRRFDSELAEAARLAPDTAVVRFWTGIRSLLMNSPGEAVAQLSQVVRQQPDNAEAQRFLGVAYQMKRDLPRAIRAFQEHLRIETQRAEDGPPVVAYQLLLSAYLEAGRFEQAVLRGKEAVEAHPDSPSLRYSYGTALLRQEEPDVEAAEFQFEQLVADHPKWGAAHGMLGQCLYLRDLHREADLAFQRGIKVDDTIRVRDLVARFFLRQGDDGRALSEYQRMAERFPADPVAHRLLARFYLELDRRHRAPGAEEPTEDWHRGIAALRSGIEADPEYLANYAELGEAYLRRPNPGAEDLQNAQEAVAFILDRNPRSLEGRIIEARILLTRREVADAEKALAALLADHPDHPWSHVLMAQAVLMGDDPDLSRAREEIALALEILPDYPPALALRAQVAWREGLQTRDPKERIKRLEEALQDNPANPIARLQLVDSYAALAASDPKNLELALSQARQLLDSHPDVPASHIAYGNLLAAKARLERDPDLLKRAEGTLRKALDLRPEGPGSRPGRLALAMFLSRSNRWQDALESYSAVLELDAADAAALEGVVICLGKLNRWADAERLCRNRLATDADERGLSGYLHGVTLERLKRADEAIAAYREALDRNPQMLSAAQRVFVLLGSDEGGDRGLELAQSLRRRLPTSAFYAFQEGLIHLRGGRFAEARESLEKAIELVPRFGQAYLALRDAYVLQNMAKEADARFEQFIEQQPEMDVLWFLRGTINEHLDRPHTAERLYLEALAANPRNFIAANNLAWIYGWKLERAQDADRWARLARVGMPEDPNVADTLAWVLIIQGKFRDALELLEKAEEPLAASAQYQFHRARALAGLSRTDEARSWLDRAGKSLTDRSEKLLRDRIEELRSQLD